MKRKYIVYLNWFLFIPVTAACFSDDGRLVTFYKSEGRDADVVACFQWAKITGFTLA